MSDSETGLQLRQRGLAIVAGGLVVQLIGVFTIVGNGGWAILFVALIVSTAASVMSYTSLKDKTGLSGAAAVANIALGALSACFHPAWAGVLILVVGAIVLYFGNKQLVAGIRF